MQISTDEIAPGAYRVTLTDTEKDIFSDVINIDDAMLTSYGMTVADDLGTEFSWWGRSDWTHLINYPAARGESVCDWHNDNYGDDITTDCTLIIYNVKPTLDAAHGMRLIFKIKGTDQEYPVDIASPVDAILLRADEKKFIHTIEPWFEKIEQRNTLLFGFKNFSSIRDQFNLTSLITDGK
jgi:hypothetical protein